MKFACILYSKLYIIYYLHYSWVFFYCIFIIVDGVDRTQCCASNGVSGQCLGVCSGNITDIPTNIFDCEAHIHSFTSCYDVPLPTTVAPTQSELFYFASDVSVKNACMAGF